MKKDPKQVCLEIRNIYREMYQELDDEQVSAILTLAAVIALYPPIYVLKGEGEWNVGP